jgi:hypothetical protein
MRPTYAAAVVQFQSLRNIPPRKRRTWSERRPPQVHLGYGLLLAWWVVDVGVAIWAGGRTASGSTVFWVTFWALAVLTLLARGWWGGPTAWVFVKLLARVLGVLFLVGMVAFLVLAVATHELTLTMFWYFVPGVLSGAVLLGAGLLLSTKDVRGWYG